ncbi:protein yippee-like [Sesamum angolense]|uniref:Protein yippee-like n=1 Tax=Sesamum angolense TaxID=2727404 RepID=A0AAE2C4M2_9LAMI|nr:protein yippee-like [Sesamum angolense]
MGRLFLREFDQPSPDYLMCKSCQTPIALPEDFYCFTPDEQVGVYGLVFHDRDRRIINVIVDKAVQHRQVGADKVADIYCIKCGDTLGWKYIEIGGAQLFIRDEWCN